MGRRSRSLSRYPQTKFLVLSSPKVGVLLRCKHGFLMKKTVSHVAQPKRDLRAGATGNDQVAREGSLVGASRAACQASLCLGTGLALSSVGGVCQGEPLPGQVVCVPAHLQTQAQSKGKQPLLVGGMKGQPARNPKGKEHATKHYGKRGAGAQPIPNGGSLGLGVKGQPARNPARASSSNAIFGPSPPSTISSIGSTLRQRILESSWELAEMDEQELSPLQTDSETSERQVVGHKQPQSGPGLGGPGPRRPVKRRAPALVDHTRKEWQREVEQMEGWAQAYIREAAKGYRRYFYGLAHNLTVAGAQLLSDGKFTRKHTLLGALYNDDASCFWIALLLACDRTEIAAFERAYYSELVDPKEGVTNKQAELILSRFDINLALHYPDTGEAVMTRMVDPKATRRQWVPCLLLVYMADNQKFQPHWLPIAGFGKGKAFLDDHEKKEINRQLGVEIASVSQESTRAPKQRKEQLVIPVANLFSVLQVNDLDVEDIPIPQPEQRPARKKRETAATRKAEEAEVQRSRELRAVMRACVDGKRPVERTVQPAPPSEARPRPPDRIAQRPVTAARPAEPICETVPPFKRQPLQPEQFLEPLCETAPNPFRRPALGVPVVEPLIETVPDPARPPIPPALPASPLSESSAEPTWPAATFLSAENSEGTRLVGRGTASSGTTMSHAGTEAREDTEAPADSEHEQFASPPWDIQVETRATALRFCPYAFGHEAPPVTTRGPLKATTLWYDAQTAERALLAVPQQAKHLPVLSFGSLWQVVATLARVGLGWTALMASGALRSCAVRHGVHGQFRCLRLICLVAAIRVTLIAIKRALNSVKRTEVLFSIAEALHYPRLVEAREQVLLSHRLGEGDLLYVRERPENPAVPRRLLGGAINLRELEGLDCDGRTYKTGPVHQMVVEGRAYLVRTVLPACAEFSLPRALLKAMVRCCTGPMGYWSSQLRKIRLTKLANGLDEGARMMDRLACKIARGALTRHQVHAIRTDKREFPEFDYNAVQHLPSEDAKVRALYALMKPTLPDRVQGVFVDVRGPHLASPQPLQYSVKHIAEDLARVDEAAIACLGSVPAFGVPFDQQHKNCVSCRRPPPAGPYRWKHRVCPECRRALDQNGYVSHSGAQLQMNLQVPDVHPGLVQHYGSQFPPSAKKWQDVDTLYRDQRGAMQSRVKICWSSARVKERFGSRGVKWDNFVKEDMEKLASFQDRHPKFTHAGIACSGATPMVSAKTVYNQAKAILGRVFRQQAPAAWGAGPYPGLWQKMQEFVDILLPGFKEDVQPMSFEEWLQTMPARRKLALQRAHDQYVRRGLRPSDRFFKAFVKEELLPGFAQTLALDTEVADRPVRGELFQLQEMLDRLIQGPADITHTVNGRFLKPYVQRLKKVWHSSFPIVYGSAGPETLHKFLQRLVARHAMFVEIDYSMFDSTFSDDCVDFMESLYTNMAGNPDCKTVLDWWRRPEGFIGPFKYSAGRTMNASGRDDTALMNGVLNGIAATVSFAAAYWMVSPMELTVTQLKAFLPYMDLSVCGDDSLCALPPLTGEARAEFSRRVSANIRMFGFEAKMAIYDQVEDATYLGKMAHQTEKGWFWAVTPGRSSYKMPYIKRPSGRDVMAEMTGIADMHMKCSSVSPILYELAKRIVELRQGAKRTPVVLDPNKPWEWTLNAGVVYDQTTVECLAGRYSRKAGVAVNASDIWRLIEKIRGVQQLPCVLDDPTWRLIIATDDL